MVVEHKEKSAKEIKPKAVAPKKTKKVGTKTTVASKETEKKEKVATQPKTEKNTGKVKASKAPLKSKSGKEPLKVKSEKISEKPKQTGLAKKAVKKTVVNVQGALKNSKDKALKVKKAVQLTTYKANAKKPRYSASFRRPHTLRVERNPKYPRYTKAAVEKFDSFSVIKHPLTTELCMKKLEDTNTLTFIVDNRANKYTIKKAVKARYDVDVAKITTLNLMNGTKKAYVKLTPDVDAIEVANRIGMV